MLLVDIFAIIGMLFVLNWSIEVFKDAGSFYFTKTIVIENIHAAEVKASPVEKPADVESEGETSSLPPAREVIATTYNAEVGQTDSDPFTMASGKKVYEGAVASNCHKIGTKLEIEGKTYVVEDRMNKRYTALCGTPDERVDIFKWDRRNNFKKKVFYREIS